MILQAQSDFCLLMGHERLYGLNGLYTKKGKVMPSSFLFSVCMLLLFLLFGFDGEVAAEVEAGFGGLVVAYVLGGHAETVGNVEHEGGEAVGGGDGG